MGSKAEAVDDTRLSFEVGRSDVTLRSYDFVNNKLILKANIPDDYAGVIHEVALFSTPTNIAAGDEGSRILTTFDSATEDWVDATSGDAATFNSGFARIGLDALRQTPVSNGTKTDALKEISLDLSGYSAADKFVLAYNVGTSFTSSVRVLLMTDASNYYTVNFGTPTAGYKVTEITKGAATATGTPNWGNITEIRVSTISTSSGSSQLDFDGLRIEDVDTVSSDYVMVSRELLSAPFTKQIGMTQEIEFAMDVNV